MLHRAASQMGQAGDEVHAVADVAVGDVGGAMSSRDPGQSERGGADTGLKLATNSSSAASLTARNVGALGNGGSRLRSTSVELALGTSSVS